jgi:soluble lytic murein transglycosylase-like protein
MRRIFLVLLLLANVCPAYAADKHLLARERMLEKYFDYPCRKFGIPKPLAMAIARQESDMHPWILNLAGKDVYPRTEEASLKIADRARRAGITYDVGIMQVNSYWIKKYNIPHRLLLKPASNIYMGCWILAQEIKKHGLTWKAVGRYHSPTNWRARNYTRLIRRHLQDILVAAR